MTGQGRYDIERTLGRGGMATVYLARDTELDRPVALKVLAGHLAGDEAYRARFLREARLAARLGHVNAVQIYDVGEDERGVFIVMEYVEGETLAEVLKRRKRIPPEEAASIGVQLCAALEQAHAAGLVHRDVKPQNVLIGAGDTVKLSDFGVARALEGTRLTEHGTVLGTAAYLAPEQARGEQVTGAADLYAVGVVLYELLTGKLPFEGETLPALLLQREQGTVVPPRDLVPEVPQELEDVVMHCLARLPEYRPESAAVLARELADAVSEVSTDPLPTPTGIRATEVLPATAPTLPLRSGWARSAHRMKPHRRRIALFAAIPVLVIAAVGAVLAADGDEPSGSPPTSTTAPAPPPQPAATEPPAAAPTPPEPTSCTALEERRDELEAQKKALDDQKKRKGKGQRKALEAQKKALEHSKRELDRRLKACR